MKKIISLLTERGVLATTTFLLWQTIIATIFLLTAITHKTLFSQTTEYWITWSIILLIWLAIHFTTYFDSKWYLQQGRFPPSLFVPAGCHILYSMITISVLAFYLYYSLGLFTPENISNEIDTAHYDINIFNIF